MVAIDKDARTLERFRAKSGGKWAGIPVHLVPRKFEEVNFQGDVVYFEFCMHMMEDPQRALSHAHSMARDVVVIDHLPGSQWVYYWAGEESVLRSTRALESFGIKRKRRFTTEQKFEDWKTLAEELAGLGEESRRRVLELKGVKDLRMSMDYCLYLL